MLKNEKEYQDAIKELQVFLDAPTPPPPGSAEAHRAVSLLEAIEGYEKRLQETVN